MELPASALISLPDVSALISSSHPTGFACLHDFLGPHAQNHASSKCCSVKSRVHCCQHEVSLVHTVAASMHKHLHGSRIAMR